MLTQLEQNIAAEDKARKARLNGRTTAQIITFPPPDPEFTVEKEAPEPINVPVSNGNAGTTALSFRPTMHEVLRATCAYYGIPEDHIKSARRTGRLVRARQVAVYLGDKLTLLCITQIGRIVNRDHSTCLHAVRRVTEQRETIKEVDAAILYITKMLKERASNV